MQQQVATLLNERNAMLGAIAHDVKTYIQRLKLRLDVLDVPDQMQKAGFAGQSTPGSTDGIYNAASFSGISGLGIDDIDYVFREPSGSE